MLPTTPMKNLPSNRGSRESLAREHIRQSRFMLFASPYPESRVNCVILAHRPHAYDSEPSYACWTFSDRTKGFEMAMNIARSANVRYSRGEVRERPMLWLPFR